MLLLSVLRKLRPASSEAAAVRARWLSRNLLAMSLSSLLSDLGHEMATAALPLFLITLGASPAALGIIEGVSDGASTMAKVMGGRVADRVEIRHLAASAGYFITGVSTGLFSLARSWTELLVARTVGWFSRGIRGPARDAMLADSTPGPDMGKAFGLHRAADTLGAVMGPLVAMVALEYLSLQTLFLITAIPGILAGACFLLAVDEPRRHERGQKISPRPWQEAVPAVFRRFLFAVGLFGIGDFAHSMLVMRAAMLMGGTSGAMTTAIFLYAVHNAVHALMSFPLGALGDRFSRRRMLALCYGLNAVTAMGFAFAPARLSWLLLLFALAGTVMAAQETLESAIAAELAPAAVRGTGFGVLAATNGLGDLVSSFLVGLLWTKVGAKTAFAYSALTSFGAAVMMALS